MKYIKILFTTTFILLLSMQSHAAVPADCTAKKQEIESQIAYAQKHHNTHQIARLQKALSEIETHCTDPKLLKQRQIKIAEKQQKVAGAEVELAQAKETGNLKKMARKQTKLDRSREELLEAQKALLP
ncbi:DUF1090 domain-containing protein [Salmonella enterica]|nr:DUF1090 domain-containing protein [Salmonella enterica]EEG3495003.1 DUF1090 domain-containing protein [Salmonella enterica]